jgi:uncharacterized repeat protein (TIGR03803 family)
MCTAKVPTETRAIPNTAQHLRHLTSMWTSNGMRGNMPIRRVVFLPAVWKRRSRLFRAMTHKNCFPGLTRICLVLTVALTLAVPASAEWKEKVLYSFQGIPDGSLPIGGVVFDKRGNLYGATQDGGSDSCRSANQCGTVFQLALPAKQGDPWTETVLYVFKGNASNDGATPFGGLVIDSFGNLYGTTGYGGTGDCTLLGSKLGCGTVFEISPPAREGGAWTETILYSFPTAKQGYLPNGNLVFDSAGNLYGATMFGGGKGTTCDPYYGGNCGTVFKLSPPKTKGGKWTEKELHAFAGGTDGANPNGKLVLDIKGAVYGTTAWGGGTTCQGPGCGTAFELRPPTKIGGAWTEEILHRFTGANDGEGPNGGLIFDARGALYGTTIDGGPGNGRGTVFKLAPSNGHSRSWTETFLHVFSSCNGTAPCEPNAGVIFDSTGNLYGTGDNFLFRIKPPLREGGNWSLAVLYMFEGSPDGSAPAELIFGSTGAIYGPTGGGGISGNGTVFRAAP